MSEVERNDNDQTLDEYIQQTDERFTMEFGLSVHDLVDICWWELWNDCCDYETILEELREAEELFNGLFLALNAKEEDQL